MDKVMRAFNIILALFFSLVFISTGLLALTAFNLERGLFDPEVYKETLDDKQIYDRIPIILTDALTDASQSEYGAIATLKNLPREEREAIIRLIIPPDLLKSMTDDLIVQTIRYLDGESKKVSLSLIELKEYLLAPTGVDAVYQFLSAQPECSLEQLTNMVTGESGIILCKPPEQFLGFDLRPIYEAQIRAAARLIPEEIPLISSGQEPNKFIIEVNRVRMISRLTPIIPLWVLLIITLLVVRTFKDLLNWWGFLFVFISIPSVFVSLGSSMLFGFYFQNRIASGMLKDLPVSMVAVIQDLGRGMVEQALKPMLVQALVLGGMGVVMLIIALLIHTIKKENPNTPTSTY
jgi:hypothetical protein